MENHKTKNKADLFQFVQQEWAAVCRTMSEAGGEHAKMQWLYNQGLILVCVMCLKENKGTEYPTLLTPAL